MSRAIRWPFLAIAIAIAPAAARAQAIVLVHEGTIYADGNEGALKAPEGVGCTDSGYVVVADTGNKRLVLFSFKDGRLGSGTELKLPQLPAPYRVQVDAKGEVLVLDLKSRKVVRVAQDGSYAGTVEPKGLEGGADLQAASFKVDAAGLVYLLDGKGRRVIAVDREGAVKAQATLPAAGMFTDVAVDSVGNLYAIDAVAAVVWSAEKGAAAFKALTPSLKDRMSFPTYLVVYKGKLLVVDQNGSGVVVLGIDGGYQGRQLSIGWSEGLVNYPGQLCVTDSGVTFVADRFNNRVQAFVISK